MTITKPVCFIDHDDDQENVVDEEIHSPTVFASVTELPSTTTVEPQTSTPLPEIRDETTEVSENNEIPGIEDDNASDDDDDDNELHNGVEKDAKTENKDADNEESNDLEYDTNVIHPDVTASSTTTASVATQPDQSNACGSGRNDCDHGCRLIYDDEKVTVGRTECFCSVGFSLDAIDGRTCHGKVE